MEEVRLSETRDSGKGRELEMLGGGFVPPQVWVGGWGLNHFPISIKSQKCTNRLQAGGHPSG